MSSLEHLDAVRTAEIERIAPYFERGSRILEIGAGTGKQASELARRGFDVTAIEIAQSIYAGHREFPILDYDGKTIPLPDRSVDIVFSSNVLEHVPDLAALHSEIKRVLRPGGYCVHAMPTGLWRFWTSISSLPAALKVMIEAAPRLIPRASLSRAEFQRVAIAWYQSLRSVGGLLYLRRHGERGTFFSELLLFRPAWWRRHFRENGFAILRDEPMGLFYTGNMVFAQRLGIPARQQIARFLGSSCHLFKVAPKHWSGTTST